MKKIITIIALSFLAVGTQAQEEALKLWKYKAVGALSGTHASFKNWNAGGQNTISWIALFDVEANYAKNKLSWNNGIHLGYGQNRILRTDWAKTDDVINLYSKIGHKLTKKWNLALLVDFKSQFDMGFDADGIFTSKFMAPGYLTVALGAEYKPNDKLQVLISPLAAKLTFVNDFTLANAGAFGIDSDNDLNAAGNFGLRKEVGAFVKFLYSDKVMENVTFKGKLELFTNYINNFGRIDVNLETLFSFKINKWLSASWALNLLYDDDIDIKVINSDNTISIKPTAQIKNVLSMGVTYNFL